MIRISQLKVKIPYTSEQIESKIRRTLHLSKTDPLDYTIEKKSLDARHKPDLYDVYTLRVRVPDEAALLHRIRDPKVSAYTPDPVYQYPKTHLNRRPVVVGTGPAGLFCGYALARMGTQPLLIERGAPVEERMADVDKFWAGGPLDPNSNVQFGEGGAGTFSDGKLNTLVHDRVGRHRAVLETFVQFGAPESILYEQHPHIGTDQLTHIIENMRLAIIQMGGSFSFHTLFTGIEEKETAAGRQLTALTCRNLQTGAEQEIPCDDLVLALGHSARDTFAMLEEKGLPMEAKSFAVGVRVEHPQSMINASQYGEKAPKGLPPATYKLSTTLPTGRGVYTFCMCPGGYVVNAASEAGALAINGMSNSRRDGSNANGAVVAQVTPDDFGNSSVLAGMEFQRRLERAAYRQGHGCIPVERLGDYLRVPGFVSTNPYEPQMKGAYRWADVRAIFPDQIGDAIAQSMADFDRKIPGFGGHEVLVSGVESRTSSPVRILRDSHLTSEIAGLYPCGEGAGYAGGITSAAMDGLRVAEAIAGR